MKYCILCGNVKTKGIIRALFSFPTNPDICRLWVKAVARPELLTYTLKQVRARKRICSVHFAEDNFLSDRKLKKNAVPTIKLPNTLKLHSNFKKLNNWPQQIIVPKFKSALTQKKVVTLNANDLKKLKSQTLIQNDEILTTNTEDLVLPVQVDSDSSDRENELFTPPKKDCSILSINILSNNPDPSTNCKVSEVDRLKSEIQDLKLQLLSAQNKIDSITYNNSYLITVNNKLKIEIKNLKEMTSTHTKNRSANPVVAYS